MTPPVITDDITQVILGRMARAGRTLLDAWHINTGWCEEWAIEARAIYGGEIMWLDDFIHVESWFGLDVARQCQDVNHAVLFLDGRVYDSQHPAGVASPADLDIVKGVTWEQWVIDAWKHVWPRKAG